MQAQNIGSNWQLIKTLEPFVKNKTADPSVSPWVYSCIYTAS